MLDHYVENLSHHQPQIFFLKSQTCRLVGPSVNWSQQLHLAGLIARVWHVYDMLTNLPAMQNIFPVILVQLFLQHFGRKGKVEMCRTRSPFLTGNFTFLVNFARGKKQSIMKLWVKKLLCLFQLNGLTSLLKKIILREVELFA